MAGVPADTNPDAPGGLLASGLLSGNCDTSRGRPPPMLERDIWRSCSMKSTRGCMQQRTRVSEMVGTRLVSCAAAEMLHRLPLLDLSARKTTVYHKTHEVR